MAERGVSVNHASLNRWVLKYSPEAAYEAQKRKDNTADFWRIDEIYITVRGEWVYLYRVVNRDGKTLDFMLSAERDTKAAKKFFANALCNNGIPKRITIDKSRTNTAGIKEVNNMIEQDHRFIKRLTRPMLGFKSVVSAAATLAGIETANMIRKGQLGP